MKLGNVKWLEMQFVTRSNFCFSNVNKKYNSFFKSLYLAIIKWWLNKILDDKTVITKYSVIQESEFQV